MNDDYVTMEIRQPPPKPVGSYDWGDVHVHVTRRPNWFQRLMIRWFFGWTWTDEK